MNSIFVLIIAIPLIEIFLMIKIGGFIGAMNTVLLIVFTAIGGLFFIRIAGLNTIRSGFNQLINNKIPIYEIISGAALAVAAILLIIPGFLTDFIGLLLIIPFSRNFLIRIISSKFKKNKNLKSDFIEGNYEEVEKKDEEK
tara:strand:- start:307 stop:729 length:423 start_codon:yes stop_codon:yes gene_type:complete